jgi:hypothetical protein
MAKQPSNPAQKPVKGSAAIDSSHPLATNLIFGLALDEGAGRPHSTGPLSLEGTLVGNPQWVAGPGGMGMNFQAAAGSHISFTLPQQGQNYFSLGNLTAFSWFFLCKNNNVGLQSILVGGSASGGFELSINATTPAVQVTVQSVASVMTTTERVQTGILTSIGYSYAHTGQNTGSIVWINGKPSNGGSPSGGQRAWVAAPQLQFGADANGTFSGDIYCAYFFLGEMSQSAVQMLASEPFGLFRPITRKRIFTAAASSGSPVVPPPGSTGDGSFGIGGGRISNMNDVTTPTWIA